MNLLKSVEEPDLAQTLSDRDINIFDKLNCHLIGVIQAFDITRQTASIQIVYKKQLTAGIVSYPLLIDCPVVILAGGTASLRMPISVGDTCLVFFSDKDIDNWFANGQISLPNSSRKHSLSDGIALVGIRNLQNAIVGYENDEAGIVYNAGRMIISDNKIDISNGSKDLKGLITDLIDIIKSVKTIPAVVGVQLTLDPADISSLEAIESDFGDLLK